MNLEISKYLNEYIQDKFPMYYRAISKKDFLAFVGSIASNALFKKYSVDEIKDGATDKIIDDLVNTYAQVKLTNVWANFGSFCEYIKNVIISGEISRFVVEELNEQTLDSIIMDIALDISKDNSSSYSDFMNGSYDKIFLNSFYGYYDRMKHDCYQHIKNVIVDVKLDTKYDDLTYEYILDSVMNYLLQENKIDDIISGMCDERIVIRFEVYSRELKNKVQEHVAKVLNDLDFYDLINITSKDIIDVITKKAMETGEISAYKVISGQLDQNIVNYARKKGKLNDPNAAKKHVLNTVKVSSRYDLPNEVLERFANEIFGWLCEEKGYTNEEIAQGQHDSLISNIVETKTMMYFSVENKKSPKKVKRNPRKRKMHKNVSMLLIVATLVGTLGAASYGITKTVVKGVDDFSTKLRYNSASSSLNGSRYDVISTKYTDSYSDNARYVVDDYNNYSKFGEIYGYMGFYEAYRHITDDRLAIMDAMLEHIESKISSGKYNSNLDVDTHYFLEFAYDRLVEMGCKEIKEDKYADAVIGYKRAANSNFDDNKTTMDCIKETDRKLEKIIEEIMEMYDKYSSMYYKELYELVGDSVSLSEVSARRRI